MQNSPNIITNKYVTKFMTQIKSTNPNDYLKIMLTMENVYKIGFEKSIQNGIIKRIKGQKEMMHELIVSTPSLEYRFMGAINHDNFVLVNGFIKKDQKTRKKEIDLTKQRLR